MGSNDSLVFLQMAMKLVDVGYSIIRTTYYVAGDPTNISIIRIQYFKN
jgi:hypothetical protein